MCRCFWWATIVQESRDELQRTKDQAETKGEELEACRQQSAELEIRLGTAQVLASDFRIAKRVPVCTGPSFLCQQLCIKSGTSVTTAVVLYISEILAR